MSDDGVSGMEVDSKVDDSVQVESEQEITTFESPKGQYTAWNPLWRSNKPGNVAVTFQAKAGDNITVALSPAAEVQDPMYELVLGGWRNSKSVIRRGHQKEARALCLSSVCSKDEFRDFWIRLKDGMISCGTGQDLGKSVIIAWKDPEPLLCEFVSFTTWRGSMDVKDVLVSTDESEQMEDIEWTSFVPSATDNLSLPNSSFGSTSIATRNSLVTGFDITTEQERIKQQKRAARFELSTTPAVDPEVQAKIEKRAARFQIPVKSKQDVIDNLKFWMSKLRAPRKDPLGEEQRRPEAIHVHGPFDKKFTKDVVGWFREYGIAGVEWIHDCSLNIVFSEAVNAKRALSGLGHPIEADADEELKVLVEKGWVFSEFDGRCYLLRVATVTDVKPSRDSEFRTHASHPAKRSWNYSNDGRRKKQRRSNPTSITSMDTALSSSR